MKYTQAQTFTAAADWLAFGRDELAGLVADIRELAASTRHQWDNDPRFRARVIRQALEGLAAVVLKGPRATLLWIVALVANLVASIALMLDEGAAY